MGGLGLEGLVKLGSGLHCGGPSEVSREVCRMLGALGRKQFGGCSACCA